MSADLLAEFDNFYTPPRDNKPTSAPAFNDLSLLSSSNPNGLSAYGNTPSQLQTNPTPADDVWGNLSSYSNTQPKVAQNDIWDAFEFPESKPAVQSFPSTQAYNPKPISTSGLVSDGVIRKPTLDLFSRKGIDETPSRANVPKYLPPKPKSARQSSSGEEILFDATDELEDEDEFGEFETVSTPMPQSNAQPVQSLDDIFGSIAINTKPAPTPINLLSTKLSTGALPHAQTLKSPSFQERNLFADLKVSHATSVPTIYKEEEIFPASPVTVWPISDPRTPKPDLYQDSPALIDEDDEWGEFADLPAQVPTEMPAVASANATSDIEADAWAWDGSDQIPEPLPPVNAGPPPTNIPPPSVLLAIFPALFDLPQSTLFKAVANQPFSLKNRIISDPSTIDFLRAYLFIATVAARIIAGRKLRWKRDIILSQAMKIGPAAAGGKGGMKLTGVDKAEVRKEDREAADVIRVWKEQLGRLKSAVAVANTSLRDPSSHLVIPEINEVMHVKTQEKAMTAPRPCIICGLKRDERVDKTDVNVEDSFGEWWTEYWGHRACRNFWQEHERKLKQR